MKEAKSKGGDLALRILPDGQAFALDDELERAVNKSVPYDPQYDALAIALRQRNGADTKNLLKTRRQKLRARHRGKKDRLGEWERLDDLYFSCCHLLHAQFPDWPLFSDLVELFQPKGVAELTMELVYSLIGEHVRDRELEVENYTLRVLAGEKEGVTFKAAPEGKEHLLDLRVLYAIARSLDAQKKYAGLAQAIVDIGEPAISAAVISKNRVYKPNNLLGRASLDALWEQRDLRIMRKLSDLPRFVYGLSDAQAREAMRIDDREINMNLKANLDLPRHAITRRSGRISATVFRELEHFLAGARE